MLPLIPDRPSLSQGLADDRGDIARLPFPEEARVWLIFVLVLAEDHHGGATAGLAAERRQWFVRRLRSRDRLDE
jgi:hypothetical protein